MQSHRGSVKQLESLCSPEYKEYSWLPLLATPKRSGGGGGDTLKPFAPLAQVHLLKGSSNTSPECTELRAHHTSWSSCCGGLTPSETPIKELSQQTTARP